MRHPFKDFFFFSRNDRRGIVLLVIVLVLMVVSGQYITHWWHRLSTMQEESRQQDSLVEVYKRFSASLQHIETAETKRKYERFEKREETFTPVLVPFDPNNADSMTFRQLGLPAWMARNILRYRRKGGHFERPEDFRKIYGLTDEQYTALAPYIRIDTTKKDSLHTPSLLLPAVRKDTLYKYPAGTVIELNAADTTALKGIPGIGNVIARRITEYRQQLGGYHHLEQLREIHLNPEQLRVWIRIDTTSIRRIHLNQASIRQLNRHPYINFYQARVIVEHRRKHGRLRSLKSLALYDEFTAEDLNRLVPYVCFE